MNRIISMYWDNIDRRVVTTQRRVPVGIRLRR